ncbi:MAG: hypothetical protein JSV72_18650, partial [Ralstonia sp.]
HAEQARVQKLVAGANAKCEAVDRVTQRAVQAARRAQALQEEDAALEALQALQARRAARP